MTPTLAGRWMTRLLLYILVGLPVTTAYAAYVAGNGPMPRAPFHVIDLMFLIGLMLDPIYIQIQRARWDHDWPFAFQLLSMCGEFLLVWYLIDNGYLSMLIGVLVLQPSQLLWHFFWIVIFSFAALLGGLQVLYPRWRFKGGTVGRFR